MVQRLTRQAIRRGSFGSVLELVARIENFTSAWNAGATPFTWVKTADEILAKAVRKVPAASEIPTLALGDGGSTDTIFRVYWYLDEALRAFVVGQVGRHLPDTTN